MEVFLLMFIAVFTAVGFQFAMEPPKMILVWWYKILQWINNWSISYKRYVVNVFKFSSEDNEFRHMYIIHVRNINKFVKTKFSKFPMHHWGFNSVEIIQSSELFKIEYRIEFKEEIIRINFGWFFAKPLGMCITCNSHWVAFLLFFFNKELFLQLVHGNVAAMWVTLEFSALAVSGIATLLWFYYNYLKLKMENL